ncbi:hypothetical protein MtrunA17_Chr1g0163871 [Medicago truncatula]|uniref:Uncharacterized protein n=1 Tax=Medicago truncatula TaxID=3880 RepID=A0A072TJJ9_MEDTR|nr:hypothetical protein MTR_0006s0110 [Medicago truncatula]RHN78290.1 hypothetical protein MtrunA17_Chr1g0163871 [Medicago truncatula]
MVLGTQCKKLQYSHRTSFLPWLKQTDNVACVWLNMHEKLESHVHEFSNCCKRRLMIPHGSAVGGFASFHGTRGIGFCHRFIFEFRNHHQRSFDQFLATT